MLKKYRYKTLLAFIIILLQANNAYAKRNTDYELTLEGYYYRYDEKKTPFNTFFMRDLGWMYGINFNMQQDFRFKIPLQYRLETSLALSSRIKYKSNSTGTSNDSKYYRYEIRNLVAFSMRDYLSLYTGLGIRRLVNDDSDLITSTGHVGYFRESLYYYMPLGVGFLLPSFYGFNFHSRIAYNLMLYARQYTGLYGGTFNYQPEGYGLSVSLDIEKPQKYISWIGGIFIRYWDVEDSEVAVVSTRGRSLMEPKNKTIETGIRIGIKF